MSTDEQAASFDADATLYDRARPGYPEQIVEGIVTYSGIPARGRILEIGPGTGQITLPFAERGYSILGVERGASLARFASERFRSFPDVKLINKSFEEWSAPASPFDLFLSAQAFHWIDPSDGVSRAARLLKEKGCLALVWNLQARSRETDFWKATEKIYDKYNPVTGAEATPMEERIHQVEKAIDLEPGFHGKTIKSVPWDKTYSGGEYLDLLNTYSDHRTMAEPRKTAFFREIQDAIRQVGGTVLRRYETVALMARRRPDVC